MQRLYYADPHFSHKMMLEKYPSSRPFETVRQMNEHIVEMHNARAFKDTDIYIIGDFAITDDDREIRKCFEAMRGSKHLIVGNHDETRSAIMNLKWSTVSHRRTVNDEGRKIFLDHFPHVSWPGMYSGHYHFHGHTHGKLQGMGKRIDLGMDAWNLQPVTASEAITRMREWNADFDTYAPEHPHVITSAEENQTSPGDYKPVMYDAPGYGWVK